MFTALFAGAQSSTIVISQVYGAGGNNGAVYKADFVELHNISAVPQSLNGLSIQYGSASTVGAWTGIEELPDVTIPAGGYYLIKMSGDGTNGVDLPTPDLVADPAIAMAAASGKVALVVGTTPLTGCTTVTGGNVIDFVGYGAANCGETATTATISATTAAIRKNNGCLDTDNNSTDFEIDAPNPRNSSSAAVSCSTSPVPTLTANPTSLSFGDVFVGTTSASQTFSLSGTQLTGFPGNITLTSSNTSFQVSLDDATWGASISMPYTAATLNATTVYVRFNPTVVGAVSGTIDISGGGVATTVQVAVSGNAVAPPDPELTANPDAMDFGNVMVGSSLPSSFDLTGANLTGAPGDITLTASPADFEVSLDNTNWSTSVDVAYTSGTLSATTVYVRFAPLSDGNISGTVSITGGGATETVTLNGVGVPAGTPTLNVSTLNAFGAVCLNTTAGPESFTINGANLNTTDVVVGPLAGYAFASSAAGPYTATLNLTSAGGTFTETVFVQFTPTVVQSYDGNIPVTGGGATAVNVATSGSGVNTTATVTTGAASSITHNSAVVSATIGSIGCSAVTAYGFEYSTTSGFTTGTDVPSNNLSGSDFSASLTGLTASTTYYYKAYVENAGGKVYGAEMSFTTLAPPPATVTTSSLADFGAVCVNTTAGPESFDITGTNLTGADVVIGPLDGFAFATTAAGPFTATVNITPSNGEIDETIYVQFTPEVAGSYSGNIPVTGGGLTTTHNVAVTGSGDATGASVNTTDSLAVSHQEVRFYGQLVGAGCAPITSYGFEYSSIAGFIPGSGTTVVSTNADATGNFSAQASGLVPNTRYYFRAFTNTNGVMTYGDELSVTTKSMNTGLIVYGNPIQRGGTVRYSLDNIRPGHYSVRLINRLGQVAYQHDVIVPNDFIVDQFVIPSYLAAGTYTFQVISTSTQVSKQVLIMP